MANAQDAAAARQQALDAAVKQKLTSHQQAELQRKIEQDLARQRQQESHRVSQSQKEAERQATFDLYRQAKAEAAQQGIDINRASFRTTTQGDQRVIELTKARGTTSKAAQSAAQKEAEKQAVFDMYRELKQDAKQLGYDVNRATFRSQQTPSGSKRISVEGADLRDVLQFGTMTRQQARDQLSRSRELRMIEQQPQAPLGAADYPIMVPRGLGRYEGRESSGDISSVSIFGTDDYINMTEIRRQPGYTSRTERQIFRPESETRTYREAPPSNDPTAGLIAPIGNLVESIRFPIADLFGYREVPRYTVDRKSGLITEKRGIPNIKPEVEADLITAGIESGYSTFVQGRPTGEPFVNRFVSFSQAPVYFGASAITSILLWLGPGLALKGGRYLSKALTAGRTARTLEAGLTLPDRPYPINPKNMYEFKPASDFDPFGTGWFREDVISRRMDERAAAYLKEIERAEETKDPIGSRFAPKDISKGFKESDFKVDFETITAADRESVFAQASKQTQKAEKTQADKLQEAMEQDVKRITGQEVSEKAARDLEQAQRKAEKEILREESRNVPLGLGGNVGGYTNRTPLGFRGITGAERRRRRIVDDFSIPFIAAIPKGSAAPFNIQEIRSGTNSLVDSLLDAGPLSGSQSRISTGISERLFELNNRASMGGSRTSSLSDVKSMLSLDIGPMSGSRQDSDLAQSTQSLLDTQSLLALQQTGREITLRDIINTPGRPTTTRTPPGPRIIIPPLPFAAGETRKKKRKGKSRRTKYGPALFSTDDIIFSAGFTKRQSRRFRALYGPFY